MSDEHAKHCLSCFGALADSTRLQIVRGLQNRSANVSDITQEVGLTQPTISHHLKILGDGGFIVKEKRGRETFYTFNKNYPCKGCGVFSATIR